MTRIGEPPSRAARLLGWAQLLLFSLNVAWVTICYEQYRALGRFLNGEYPVRYLGWRVPVHLLEPPAVLHQVLLSFVLCVLLFLPLLLLARLALVRAFLRAFAGPFGIAAYPLFALCFPYYLWYPTPFARSELWLFLETVAVLALWVYYCSRKGTLSSAAAVAVLSLHFSLWAWKTRSYTFGSWDDYSATSPQAVAVLFSYTFYYGFPVFGFLLALASGWYFKLLSDHAPTTAPRPSQQRVARTP